MLTESPDVFKNYTLRVGYAALIWNGTVLGSLRRGMTHFQMVSRLQEVGKLSNLRADEFGIYGPYPKALMKEIRKTRPENFILQETQNVFRLWNGSDGAVLSSWGSPRAVVQYFPQVVELCDAISFPYTQAIYEFMPSGTPLMTYGQLFRPRDPNEPDINDIRRPIKRPVPPRFQPLEPAYPIKPTNGI